MKVWYRLLGGWHETSIFNINKNKGIIHLNNGAVVSIKGLNKYWTIRNPHINRKDGGN